MRRLSLSLVFLLAAACGGAGAAFDPSYPDASPERLAEALARLERPEGPPTLVAVSAREQKVLAFDLARGRALFTEAFAAVQAPIVAGEVIVLSDGERVVGLARDDGQRIFALPLEGRHLVGASGAGRSVVLTLSGGGHAQGAGRVVAIDGGRVRWSRDLGHPAGVPAYGGELVAVPWAHQNLSLLRASDGVEVARTRALGVPMGHAELTPLGLVAGQTSLFLVEPSLAKDPRIDETSRIGPPALPLPGSPPLRPDPYARPEPPTSARHRVLLDVLPARGERGLVPERDMRYFAFHSVLLGLEGERIAWSLRLEGAVAGLAPTPGGVFVVSTEGQVLFAAADQGAVRVRHELPFPIDLAVIANAEEPRVEAAPLPRAAEADWQHLVDLAREKNAQLAPVARLALHALAAHEDPASTAELAGLCDDRGLTPPIREAACKALGEREIGYEGLVDVLSRHASFLEGTSAPPVGALARAALKIGDRAIAPLLVGHLRDPATPGADLAHVAAALGALGDAASAEALGEFLTTYHAYRDDRSLEDALVAAAEAYAALLGEAAAPLLTKLREDPFTVPALSHALARPTP